MKDDEIHEPRRRSAWLPASLLFLLLLFDAGAVYWLTRPESGPEEEAAGSEQPVLKGSESAGAPAEPAAPKNEPAAPAPPAQQNDTAPPAQQNDTAAPPETARPEPPPPPPPMDKPEDREPPPVPALEAKPEAAPPAPPPPAAPAETPARPESKAAEAPAPQILPNLPPAPPGAPLSEAPDPGLIETSRSGPLPIVGRDGREPWRVYARPFDQLEQRPRISVVLYGLGPSAAATRTAIQALPGVITLAFSPYADGLENWMASARAAGHEVLLMVPMEPRNYPDYDPGPRALLTTLTDVENIERLEWMLGRGVGYVGITDFMGSRFTNSAAHMRTLFGDLRKRGLLYLESRAAARAISGQLAAASGVPFASNALYIDSQASRPAIDAQLAEAERLARQIGAVVVMGFLYPVTIERVAHWAATAERRGFALAPVSALAKRGN